MKAKQYTVFIFFAVMLGLMPMTKGMAAELLPPQQAIEEASTKLQAKLQDESFIQDFVQVAGFVNEVILPHTDFDRISALVLGQIYVPKKIIRKKKN
jgi:phospholipid transport system substrate-binding protein